MAKSKAAVFVGAGKPLELWDFDLPNLEAGELLVRMNVTGICGTDVHRWHNTKTPTPMIFGHENVGIIEEIGKGGVNDAVGNELFEGDRVVFGGRMPCGRCYICTVAQEPTSCERGLSYGASASTERPFLRGGFANYVHLVQHAKITKIPDEISIEKAILAVIGNRTLIQGFEKIGGIQAGDTVVIQGSGPIGLAALIQAKLAGAMNLIIIGAPQKRLEVARQIGAKEIVSIEELRDPDKRIIRVMELTEGNGADLVVEASGGPTAVEEGIRMTRVGGKYLIIGQATDYGPMAINPYHIARKQLRVFGSWAAQPVHLYRALRSMEKFDFPMNRLVTHRFTLAEATKGLESVEKLNSIIAVIEQ
ncbi:MAG: alcohol dehydrogenase [Thaumarchaeota archaeon]|nr:alcohol dehydrogenase [Nitrososphaerota archaeon]